MAVQHGLKTPDEILRKALEKETQARDFYAGLASDCSVDFVRELLEKLVAMSKIPITIEQDPKRLRPTDVPVVVGDCTKIREQTGWRPGISFDQSLEDVLAYWRERTSEDDKER